MIKRLGLLIVLLALTLLAGCRGGSTYSASGSGAPEPASAAAPAQASQPAQPAQTYQPVRASTTQPLPPGYGYINEKELASARK